MALPEAIRVRVDGQQLHVERVDPSTRATPPRRGGLAQDSAPRAVGLHSEDPSLKALHGLYRALVANMLTGVVTGFTKELEIVGVGYRAQLDGKQLVLSVGFSHQVRVPIPEGVSVQVPKPTSVVITGADKHLVGQFSADIRGIAPPEPYKGKGIKYAGEVIRRKAGKAATGAGAKSGGG